MPTIDYIAPNPTFNPTKTALAAPEGGPRILIVDDNPEDRELLEIVVRRAGVENPVVLMGDGEQAISYLEQSSPSSECPIDRRPALVFLDLNMPLRNGLEVLEWIRGQQALTDIKVVMMTDSQRPEHIDRARDLHADGYFIKHPSPQVIGLVVREALAPWTTAAFRASDPCLHDGQTRRC